MAPVNKLKDMAKGNPTQLGDAVSLKSETSTTKPTENDRPNEPTSGGEHKTLKQIAEEKTKTNPSQLGDPVSLKAETSDTEPTEDDRGAGIAHPEKSGKPKL